MARDQLIGGYAHALFAVAEAEGALEDVEDELFRFARSMDSHPRLRDALTDPRLPAERKRAVLEELLGGRASPHTVRLLAFVVEQGRARQLPAIVQELVGLAAAQRRREVAEVRTAVPLTAAQQKRLAQALGDATGKDVELRVIVDPGVIGGVVARVGDRVFDGSLRRRLEMARERLTQV